MYTVQCTYITSGKNGEQQKHMNEEFEFAGFFMAKLLGFNFSLLNRRKKSLTFLFHRKVKKKNNGRMEDFDDMLIKFVVQKLLDIFAVFFYGI